MVVKILILILYTLEKFDLIYNSCRGLCVRWTNSIVAHCILNPSSPSCIKQSPSSFETLPLRGSETTAALQHRPVFFPPPTSVAPPFAYLRVAVRPSRRTLSRVFSSRYRATTDGGGFDRHPWQFFAGRLLLLYTSHKRELALLQRSRRLRSLRRVLIEFFLVYRSE